MRLGAIDMAPLISAPDAATPAQGKVAFSESGILKVIGFEVDSSGVRVPARAATLDSTGAPFEGTWDMDFSPDGSRILYSRGVVAPNQTGTSPREIRLIDLSVGSAPKVVLKVSHSPTGYITQPRWLSTTEFAFLRGGGGQLPYSTDIQLAALDANDSVSTPPLTLLTSAHQHFSQDGNRRGFNAFDVARTRQALLLTVSDPYNLQSFVEFSLVDGESLFTHFSDNSVRGGYLTRDDRHIVYLHAKPDQMTIGDYVQRYDTVTRRTVKLTTVKNGSFGRLDTLP